MYCCLQCCGDSSPTGLPRGSKRCARPRKTCSHCQLGMPVSGKEREGGSLQDNSPAFRRAARWGSPSSLLNALACLLIPNCKQDFLIHCLNVCAECLRGGRGNPLVQLYFFHHDEDTRVKMEAWWPSLLERSLGVRPWAKPTRMPTASCRLLLSTLMGSQAETVWLWGIMKTKMWIVFCCSYWFLSNKPEVKNTLSLKNVIREGKKKNPKGKTKKQKTPTVDMLPEEKLWKGFSSTKNSYINHLLQDLEFKQ